MARAAIGKFILEHEQDDEKELLLKSRTILGFPSGWVADQLVGRRKAKTKLPLWYAHEEVEYPHEVNLEQCSSERTARFKAAMLKDELKSFGRAADLTAGFGVDSFYFGQIFDHVDCVEPDATLGAIAQHNHTVLGKNPGLAYHHCLAEEFLAAFGQDFDFVYVDPSRRSKTNRKVFKFKDCLPDVTRLVPAIFEMARVILIKSSPLIDLQAGQKELKNVARIFVVAVENECKEVLFLCKRDYEEEPGIVAINLQNDYGSPEQRLLFHASDEATANAEFSVPLDFLYEPNAAILKAGAFKLVAVKFGVKKIGVNTHLYTSRDRVRDFPGRTFRVRAIVKPEPKIIREFFPEGKANVFCRNFPQRPEELKKKLRLKDGGDRFLIAFSGLREKFVVVADRVNATGG